MKEKLRNYQVDGQDKIRNFVKTKGGALIIIPNAVFAAFSQSPCDDVIVNWIHIAYISINSVILMFVCLDVRAISFLKLFLIGGVSNILTKQAIGIYAAYFGNAGKSCKIPIYTNGLFTLIILGILFIGAFIWAFDEDYTHEKDENKKYIEEGFE